jgi:catechol 2,3-dioxygenase-like lactoylglutathione lyase family enzyme
VVRDIDRSERFYTEIIGMEPDGSFTLDSIWSGEAGVAKNKPFLGKDAAIGFRAQRSGTETGLF